MIRVICISNKGYLSDLQVGKFYAIDTSFKAKSVDGTVTYANLYDLDAWYNAISYKGVYPTNLFMTLKDNN